MRYAILCFETPDDFAAREDACRQTSYYDAHALYLQRLRAAGVAAISGAGGAGLVAPHAATTLRRRGGARQVVDGPYAGANEQIGGVYLIEAPDLDAALDWAELCPTATTGAVEVRPVAV